MKKELYNFLLLIFLSTNLFAQNMVRVDSLYTSDQFIDILQEIKNEKDALYVFDIDNTLLITNDNGFGSDWWYEESKIHTDLLLNLSKDSLFNVFFPIFYAVLRTTDLFEDQAKYIDSLAKGSSKTIALTSRGYRPEVATVTELELDKNHYKFLKEDSVFIGSEVVLRNSIIYGKGGNKGKILYNYVKEKGYRSIYFFDDSKDNVDDVTKEFKGKGIDISIYYIDVAPKEPFNEEEMENMKLKLQNLINTLKIQSRNQQKHQ